MCGRLGQSAFRSVCLVMLLSDKHGKLDVMHHSINIDTIDSTVSFYSIKLALCYFSFDNINSIRSVLEFAFYEPALVLSCSYTQLLSLECDCVYSFGYFNRYSIDQHDYSVRLKAARKFLADGDKVTLIIFIWHTIHTN